MLTSCRNSKLGSFCYTARRFISSNDWLTRQYNDPYTKQRLANPVMYRSRSAFKLIEIMRTHGNNTIFRSNKVRSVIDLGAAPGGWSQVMAGLMRPESKPPSKEGEQPGGFGLRRDAESTVSAASALPPTKRKSIIAVDRLTMAPIHGVHTLKMDFLAPESESIISGLLLQETGSELADVILSDMAANFTGNRVADAEAAMAICETVLAFAKKHLRIAPEGRQKGGALLMKFFQSPEADTFRRKQLESTFKYVYTIKPPASRAESSENFWLCYGFSKKAPKAPKIPNIS